MAAIDNGNWTTSNRSIAFTDKTDTGATFANRLLVEQDGDDYSGVESIVVNPENGPVRLNISDCRDLRDWLDRVVTQNEWRIAEERN